jgi:hypothetical protein
VSQDEEGEAWVDGEGSFSSLISVRAELARGDLRGLYLGWLLRAQAGELDDEDVEPPAPPGLGQLSASLENMAEFLRLDRDLVRVAAGASPPIGRIGIDHTEALAWLGKLATEEKDELIADLLIDGDNALVAELLKRFLKERTAADRRTATTQRTVGAILRAAEAYSAEQQRIEAEKRAKETARREREAAIAREKRLDSLVGRETELWARVDALVAAKQPRNYDQAVKTLVDPRDLAARGAGSDFALRIERLRQTQARKPSFIERLGKAGL